MMPTGCGPVLCRSKGGCIQDELVGAQHHQSVTAHSPEGFSSRWEIVDGLRVHALEPPGGPGAAVVLVPGLVTASRSMLPLARALARHGVRSWIVDLPGFGYSDKPRRAL